MKTLSQLSRRFFGWARWYLWDTRLCDHIPGNPILVNMGMQKAVYCTRCCKCLKLF